MVFAVTRWTACTFILVLGLLGTEGVQAQSILEGLGGSDAPVSISAENGIEWDQERKTYAARGNVQAAQGDFFVSADALMAFYSELKNGNPDVHTFNAEGNVYASFGTNQLVGDKLEFIVQEQRAIVTGKEILLQSEQGNLSATEKLIYDGQALRAEAVGNPQISQGENIVAANHIIALFLPNGSSNSTSNDQAAGRLRQVEANGEVFITNGSAVCRGNNAAYDVVNERAVLAGNVSCTQCNNQLIGDRATIDMRQGQAKVESLRNANSNGRTILFIDPTTARDGKC